MNNKGVTITLITILTIILFTLVGGMIFLLNSNFEFNNVRIFSGQSTKLVEEKEINNIKDLNITSNVADIEINESDTNSIKVEFYSDYEEEHNIVENSNDIEITFKSKKKYGIMFLHKTPVVKIYVPSSYSNDVKINTETSDIKINNLPNSNLDANLKTGDVRIKQIKNANIVLTTGDIDIEKVTELNSTSTTGDIEIGTINKMVTSTTTGDIKVSNVDSIEAKTTTGDIKIDNVNNSLILSTTTGDVKVENAAIKVNSNINTGTGDVKIESINGCYVEGSTKVGDTKINNSDRKSDIELKITTRVGDIKVND